MTSHLMTASPHLFISTVGTLTSEKAPGPMRAKELNLHGHRTPLAVSHLKPCGRYHYSGGWSFGRAARNPK